MATFFDLMQTLLVLTVKYILSIFINGYFKPLSMAYWMPMRLNMNSQAISAISVIYIRCIKMVFCGEYVIKIAILIWALMRDLRWGGPPLVMMISRRVKLRSDWHKQLISMLVY